MIISLTLSKHNICLFIFVISSTYSRSNALVLLNYLNLDLALLILFTNHVLPVQKPAYDYHIFAQFTGCKCEVNEAPLEWIHFTEFQTRITRWIKMTREPFFHLNLPSQFPSVLRDPLSWCPLRPLAPLRALSPNPLFHSLCEKGNRSNHSKATICVWHWGA